MQGIRVVAAVLLTLWPAAGGRAATLGEVRQAAAALQGVDPEMPPGVPAAMRLVKSRLREWLEAKLAAMPERFDTAAFTAARNRELQAAGLFCRETPDCLAATGYLAEIGVWRTGGLVAVTTGIRLRNCGVDESAYLFERAESGWRRLWRQEENGYPLARYAPAGIEQLHLAEAVPGRPRLLLLLSNPVGCAGNWRDLRYRVFRLEDGEDAPPLLDGKEPVFIPADARARVTSDSVLLEFRTLSLDGSVLLRTAVRRYEWSGPPARLTRVAPWALTPREFADAWLSRDPGETAEWLEEAGRAGLTAMRTRVTASGRPSLEYEEPTLRCRLDPDLWQVTVLSGPPRADAPETRDYLIVRWQRPYRFTLVEARRTPRRGCTAKDESADPPWATLFPRSRP